MSPYFQAVELPVEVYVGVKSQINELGDADAIGDGVGVGTAQV